MASKKKAPAEPTPKPKAPARRDVRPYIYAGLELMLGALLIWIITKAAPNRHTWAQAMMWGLPVGVLLMGVGTALGAYLKQRALWLVAVIGGAFLMVIAVIILGLLLSSAAFLTGVYGAFGRAAATGMLVACALILELIGVIPVLHLKYLMTRAGRRAFGLQPLWAKA
jgi:hypothetical protein